MAIRTGVRGLLNVMSALDMLPAAPRAARLHEPVVARSSTWVRAAASGVLRAQVELGKQVRKGEVLGVLGEPFGSDDTPGLASTHSIVAGSTALPPGYRGGGCEQ